jgi:hypothetical protein
MKENHDPLFVAHPGVKNARLDFATFLVAQYA